MKEIPVRSLATAPTSLRLSENFDIRSVEQVLGGKDVVQALHRHDHCFLLVLTTGEGMHECDFRPHTLEPHTIYSMRPGQVHRLELKLGSTGYILQFKADFLATGEQGARLVLRRTGHIEVFHTDAERYGELVMLLDRIARTFAAQQEGYLHIVRAYLSAFLADLVLQAPSHAHVSSAKGYAQERLEELLELIETNVHSTKEVAAYAELMHLSTFQLNAIAKAGTGRTCSELITDQIILEAKRYLRATTDQVTQVADRLGYNDPSYFIRFFKKHTGYTPEGFRQKSR